MYLMGISMTSAFAGNAAHAFCSEPTFSENKPDAPYRAPSPPFCLSDFKWSRKHTCDDWEIDSYVDEINRYVRQLNDYVDEANSFAKNAITFAQEAAEFAECEAKEAKEPLE